MATHLEQISEIIQLSSAFDAGKMDPIYDALATRIGGSGAKDISEAITEIRAIGEDPAKYIPVARSYVRDMREQSRQDIARLQAEQQLQHQQEQHEIAMQREQLELRKLQAAVELAEVAVINAKATA